MNIYILTMKLILDFEQNKTQSGELVSLAYVRCHSQLSSVQDSPILLVFFCFGLLTINSKYFFNPIVLCSEELL